MQLSLHPYRRCQDSFCGRQQRYAVIIDFYTLYKTVLDSVQKAGTAGASIGRVRRGGNAGELPPFSFIRRIYQVQSCYTKL